MKVRNVCLCLLWLALTTHAQELAGTVEARLSADVLTPLVGEPIRFTLMASTPADTVVVEWPEIVSNWGVFDVRSVGELVVMETADGGARYEQTLTAYLWRPGDYESPALFLGYRILGVDAVYRVPFDVVFFTVPSVLESVDLNQTVLRPCRPPVSLFYVPRWLMIAGVMVSGGMVYGGWRWRRERQARLLAAHAAARVRTPAEIALARLAGLPDDASSEEFAFVSDCVRDYIADRFAVPAPDLTSVELINTLDLPASRLEELERLLNQADLVKFASAVPTERQTRRAARIAATWIEAVDA